MKTVHYDNLLKIEAYSFNEITRPFPNHFHDYYVIGLIEKGTRILSCKNREYKIKEGNILIFNPNDNHECIQEGNENFNYKGLNISKNVMLSLSEEITEKKALPQFSENVITDEELKNKLCTVYNQIINKTEYLEKEEAFIFLISYLIEKYCKQSENQFQYHEKDIEKACVFIKENYSKHIALGDICKCCNLSKSSLLRAFLKIKGITPYRYIQSLRINEAKKLLENGYSPIETAGMTGFSDQSHFSNFFNAFIGLTPAEYKRIFQKRKELK